MADDVILNKVASIERCMQRIAEEYKGHESDLKTNFTRQDAIVLNVLRACESAIDLAMHIVRKEKLGVPQSSRDSFGLLATNSWISKSLAENLMNMVGFRNIAVHNYRELNIEILKSILEQRLSDFTDFTKAVIKHKYSEDR